MNKPTLRDFFKAFFNIWLTGYGWPAVLWQMKNVFVHQKNRISEDDFMESLSISQILPWAIGVNLSGYLWFRFFSVAWAILMVLAYILPPFILMMILSYLYFRFGEVSFVKSVMHWLGALVVALIFNAIFQLWWWVFKKITLKSYKLFAIMIFSFIVTFFFKEINIIFVILGSWLLAFLLYYFTWEFGNIKEDKQEKKEDTKIEKHIKSDLQSKKKKYSWIIVVWVVFLWILLYPATRDIFYHFFLIWSFAFWWGFTAIPIIQHQIVDVLQRLPLQQFRDGIALGQITPWSFLISASFIWYKVYGVLWATVATLWIFSPPIILITALSKIHTKIKELLIFRVVTKWFMAWFIWILVSTLIYFWQNSLIDYKTWLIFLWGFLWMRFLKKGTIRAILLTITISFFIF